jgi:indolepyruvate ferredoxin oxidoreductase
VVTVNQILGTAALLDGKHVLGLDQTGLSQKGGPVVSHLKIYDRAEEVSNKVGAGEADAYLGFDILVATSAQNLDHASPDKTLAVVSTSKVPTGAMVTSTEVQFPETAGLRASVDRVSRKDDNVFLDALALAERLFDDHMAANLIVLGAAYQAGAIPVGAAAIEQAITLNGVAVPMNTQAFRAGRLAVADPEWAAGVVARRPGAAPMAQALTAEARALVDSVPADAELRRLLEVRVPELVAYQDARYARQYVEFVRQVREAEQRALPGESRLSEAVARYLFKLMAYKDEYEVARLHLRDDLPRRLADEFPDGVDVHYRLHPPFLRAIGLRRKLRLGTWFDVVFRLLVSLRGVRGTALDPFGYARVRQAERELIGEYRALVDKALVDLSETGYERAVALARLPDLIRGYEDIKLGNVKRFREAVRALGF